MMMNTITSKIVYLLSNCTSLKHIHQIQAQLILQGLYSNTTIAHHFITASQSLGLLNSALALFTQLHRPHVFICNTLIRAFSHSHIPHTPLYIYNHMHRNCVLANNYTFPFLLNSLSDSHDLKQAQCVHTHVVKLGHLYDIYVQNSLLDVYASCGQMGLCHKVFDEMPQRDVVSWTVLIMGYKNAGKYDDALMAFEQMQYAGVVPNHVTMVNALAACANFGALDMGVWIHDFIKRSGWELDVILGTALIDMYGKCGRIEEGFHSGFVDTGRWIFNSLIGGKYGFSPGVKHYACMVDLFARAGYLEDAFKFIRDMPFEPTKAMWGSLLAGSRARGNLKFSEFAAWKLVELEPENSGYYVVLSNLFAEMGRWSDVEKVRMMMKERGLMKDLGCSSVELEPQEHVYELLVAH
ncbi:hypothetical protein RGQ29_008405 [Quercus rubra]|uniref:Pentatricopeptide repeat-containing protein n=1 Tax=Quercus rubra TaxID=3512 RepID=A0AAN7E048_QUERU|nr:hypothetical protein RGQ29_008405 [Quercus rubra]